MLNTGQAFSSFSVNDTEKTQEFYNKKLGVKTSVAKGMKDCGLFEIEISGGNNVMVYPKKNHQPASFTVLNFPVDDIDKMVDELTEKGVVFEHYNDEMIKTDEKGDRKKCCTRKRTERRLVQGSGGEYFGGDERMRFISIWKAETHGRASQRTEGRASQRTEDRASQRTEFRASQRTEFRASQQTF